MSRENGCHRHLETYIDAHLQEIKSLKLKFTLKILLQYARILESSEYSDAYLCEHGMNFEQNTLIFQDYLNRRQVFRCL